MSNIRKSKMEDEALINRFLSGDEQGFTMLAKKYQDQVINIIHSLTDAVQEASDIAQEVFIKVYRNLRFFRKKAQFNTWLYRITVNTTYNYLKKEKRYAPLENISDVAADQRAKEVLEQKERQELVREALKRLPFQFRTAIVLKEIEGLSYTDIARTMGCRIGTVESRLFRARSMLKEILAPVINEAQTYGAKRT